ncbi:hypothetical protein K4S27_11170 [Staphylococcus epidermidis]|nr:hypothetical protein [Staphylococcus epidermidis]MCG2360236.1 hypothetical protein [Staphylococcus epidermidis]MCG2367190.1 hypothetical protein [Staphylococcus epidermidis]
MNLLKVIGEFLAINVVAILFLLGLTLVNVATYLQFDLVIGLIVTGVTFILIALLAQFEKSQQPPQ